MSNRFPSLFVCAFLLLSAIATPRVSGQSAMPQFHRTTLTERFFSEGACAADINGDGQLDLVSGPFWYQGPSFSSPPVRWMNGEPRPIVEYSDHFFTFARDFSGDGRVDLLRIGMPGTPAQWYENPGEKESLWPAHNLLDDIGGESPTLADLTGDGIPELICVHAGAFGYASQVAGDPHAAWTWTPISEDRGLGRFTHGLGIGDVNGDGRTDLLEATGWWEQPRTHVTDKSLFLYHPFPFAKSGGAQMFVEDFDGDGDGDVVSVQNAHGWGLSWFERRGDADDVGFVEHAILPADPNQSLDGLQISQMHAVALADVDGDGVRDIITGKRFYAHNGSDPGAEQLPVLYWFQAVRDNGEVRFVPHLIDRLSGVGTQLEVADMNGDGRPDIIVGNKRGTCVFESSDNPQDTAPAIADHRHTPGTDIFRENIRTTEPLSPDEERAGFLVPDGFRVDLIASEPDIAKPMNLAFDGKGRLWVSSSEEYPYPAPPDRKPRDTIRILEDTDKDGTYDRNTVFADELNIPIGLHPYQDGVICFSIPNIWFIRDTDGDGKSDTREVLYGPFDTTRDTHGMCNSFVRGLDGWIYACHGFNNQSKVSGKDGHTVTLNSGNVFRFRTDGSRIEQYTHGQVNPFGLTYDRYGDFFSADCHTKPITLLIKGGYYESFGKPHDGLGYVPNVMDHLNGSTGIAGIALGEQTTFPASYRDSAFGGNVVTSRINRDRLVRNGSSVRAVNEPDFLIAADPWFRPVDLQAGPDGGLYVADFYNRIIGHYEVPLNHPGRDRKRGRIWRITGPGHGLDIVHDGTTARTVAQRQSAAEPLEAGITPAPNPELRVPRAKALKPDAGRDSVAALDHSDRSAAASPAVLLLWKEFRDATLTPSRLRQALDDEDELVRMHAYRVLASLADDSAIDRENFRPVIAGLQNGLQDPSALVRRNAVMAAIAFPSDSRIRPLLAAFHQASPGDVHLRYVIRMALRDHLRDQTVFRNTAGALDSAADREILAGLCRAINTPAAAEFLVANLSDALPAEQLIQELRFAAPLVSSESVTKVVALARERFDADRMTQLQLLDGIRSGLERNPDQPIPDSVRGWAVDLTARLLQLPTDWRERSGREPFFASEAQSLPWSAHLSLTNDLPSAAWPMSTKRNSADGETNSKLWSSFALGEQHTGVFRSAVFEAPALLSFFIAGHDGFPDKAIQHRNFIQLRDARTQEVLRKTSPPRNDTAQQVTWDLADVSGQRVYLEVVDSDNANAYAWLAVGRFSLPGLNAESESGDRRLAAAIVERFRLTELHDVMVELLNVTVGDPVTAGAVARAVVMETAGDDRAPASLVAVASALEDRSIDAELRAAMVASISSNSGSVVEELLKRTFKVATSAGQASLAEVLSSDADGAALLLRMLEAGIASEQLLRNEQLYTRLIAASGESERKRFEKLHSGLPDESAALLALLQQRRASFVQSSGDAGRGRELFNKNCAACHQVANEGGKVGPNLDGIANRGLDRLLEDTLIPNRNVDVAFRATTILTADGRVLNGLAQESDDGRLKLIDGLGKETLLAEDQIEERQKTRLSPMPSNVVERLPDSEFRDLMAYLLSLTK